MPCWTVIKALILHIYNTSFEKDSSAPWCVLSTLLKMCELRCLFITLQWVILTQIQDQIQKLTIAGFPTILRTSYNMRFFNSLMHDTVGSPIFAWTNDTNRKRKKWVIVRIKASTTLVNVSITVLFFICNVFYWFLNLTTGGPYARGCHCSRSQWSCM